MISKGKPNIGYSEIEFRQNFIPYLILYSLFLPTTLFLIQIIQEYIIIKKFNDHFSKKDPLFRINNYRAIQNLSMISYVILDKTGTITEGSTKISSIFIKNKMYRFNDKFSENSAPLIIKNNIDQTISKVFGSEVEIPGEKDNIPEKELRVRNFSTKEKFNVNSILKKNTIQKSVIIDSFSKKSKKYSDFDNSNWSNAKNSVYISNSDFKLENKLGLSPDSKHLLSPDKFSHLKGRDSFSHSIKLLKYAKSSVQSMVIPDFETDKFIGDLNSSHNAIIALKCLILCHNTKTLVRDGNTLKFFHTLEEEEILRFSSNFSFKFEKVLKFADSLEYLITVKDIESKYRVLGINCYSNRGRFSIVLKPLTNLSEKTVLFVKGSHKNMINYLDLDEKEKNELTSLIQMENYRGKRGIIYAMRELNLEQEAEYCKKYETLHSNFSVEDDQLQDFYSSMETKLKLLSVVFFRIISNQMSKKIFNYLLN